MPTNSLEDLTPEQIERMAAAYQAALSHPETRETMLRVTKKIDPSVSIPELDIKDSLRAREAKDQEAQEKRDQEMRDLLARERVRDERQALKDQGFTADDVKAIEKLMVDEQAKGNVLTYALAASYFKAQTQIAAPTPHSARSGAQSVNHSLPSDALTALKGGRKGVAAWARDQGSAALDDIIAGRIKLH